MYKSPIIIRPAEKADLHEIWLLLHADSQAWNDEMIRAKLPELWVLTCRNRIVSVFQGRATLKRVEDYWIVTHPVYWRQVISSGVEQLMLGLFYPPMSTIHGEKPSVRQVSVKDD